MRVYHFTDSKHGLQDIRRRRLKIATIEELNDPFELLGPAPKDAGGRRRFAEWKHRMSAYTGLLCFSRDWRNPVQWSHYATGHRGVCLGFDVPDDMLIRVKYQRRRLEPRIELLDGDDEEAADEEAKRIFSTKYSHWRYEAEERSFVALAGKQDPRSKLYFAPFADDLALREVIVGHRSDICRAELARALGRLAGGVTVQKARLSFFRFAVVPQHDVSLWC
jgi:hypothetical protein